MAWIKTIPFTRVNEALRRALEGQRRVYPQEYERDPADGVALLMSVSSVAAEAAGAVLVPWCCPGPRPTREISRAQLAEQRRFLGGLPLRGGAVAAGPEAGAPRTRLA